MDNLLEKVETILTGNPLSVHSKENLFLVLHANVNVD